MTLRTLIRRSLRFHWRSHLGVVIGAAIGSAALIGALVVGDSVKGSLRGQALERLGPVTFALSSGDRLFRSALAPELQASVRDRDSHPVTMAPALVLQGSVSTGDASARANNISVIGIDPNSWSALADSAAQFPTLQSDEVLLNNALASRLHASVGDALLVRVPKISALSQEAVMVSRDDAAITLRVRCAGISGNDQLANFSLQAGQGAALNVFIGLPKLQEAIDRDGTANTLLVAGNAPLKEAYRYDACLKVVLTRSFAEHWDLSDIECEFTEKIHQVFQLYSPRIFLDFPIEQAALASDTNGQPLLTYIANLITLGTNATPYSMVTAAGTPWTPPDLADDEIVLNQWLADDLKAKPGDEIRLVYYDPESGANLTERTNVFRVHSIVPMELPWADRTLMPEFPGIEKAETTADWDTAFPLKYKIRSKDDHYWREYRGTPKAFITLAAGKKMWANRFGEVTAVRFPAQEELPGYREALEQKILSNLDPAELGLSFEPVREQALQSAQGAQDFGGLFIGFSLFLIAAALILMALLFQFGLEQRASEVGTLLALGFTHKQVRRLLLGEGAALAFIGGVVGMVGGVFYAKAMLLGLRTVWSDAVGGTTLAFFVTPVSLLIGLFASTLVAVITIWLALRKQARRPAMALLNTRLGDGMSEMGDRSRACQSADGLWQRLICVLTNAATAGFVSLTLAVALVGLALATGETANAEVFFGAGALLLIGGLALVSAWLRRLANVLPTSRRQFHFNNTSSDNEKSDLPAERRKHVTGTSLAFRGLARRRSRSVATTALLASGAFLILSIGVFRLDANRDATERTSGTGGFALMGESTIPVVQDLNSPSGREFFALDESDLSGVGFVQFRVRAGDEASCLNLNRAQKPRLLGVDPAAMEGRFTFAKVAKGLDADSGWKLLKSKIGDQESEMDAVPAIGDLNSILWAMHKKVGDTLDYVDDRGRPFQVRIVGAVANSILQGNLIIDETEFVNRFPNESGYQYFLMDAPADRVKDVSATLSRALQDYGLEMTPAADRLNQFNAVQNTYLGTFQILGGLGLLLGSAGLGIVVLRNVLERRGELAVLMAVGFRKRMIERLVLIEHAGLLGLGLGIGLIAAAVAVLPTLLSPGSQLPYATLLPTVLAVLINGLVWTWVASRVAMRGDLLDALRNE